MMMTKKKKLKDMFWEVFEGFTTEEKELYCRFACGRKRLP